MANRITTDISKETPIKEFPNKYNANNVALENRIIALEAEVAQLKVDKESYKNDIKDEFMSKLAQIQNAFDNRITQLENK